MADPVWGLLSKAQDDPELITEAITAAIAAHESDPSAHLGAGESIEVHRTNEILDHPAQSVVIDKTPFTQYDEYAPDLGAHGWSAEEGTATLNNTTVAASLFSQTSSIVIGVTNNSAGADYPDADLMYQFRLELNGYQYADGTMFLSWTGDTGESLPRMSIEKDGTSYYWRLYDGTEVVAEYNLAVGASYVKFLRIWYDSANDTIRLYVGTTEVATYVTANWRDFVFPYFSFEMSRTTNNQISYQITRWKMAYSEDVDI